jgi:hypothetical protein
MQSCPSRLSPAVAIVPEGLSNPLTVQLSHDHGPAALSDHTAYRDFRGADATENDTVLLDRFLEENIAG